MIVQEKLFHPFTPIVDDKTEILILGSFPSVISRKENFYYMNKNNRFYKVLSAIYAEDFYHADLKKKIALLHQYHIGLFDVISSCIIHNSSDLTIKEAQVNDIPSLIKDTAIRKIVCNGKKAYELLLKAHGSLQNMTIYCPSTSSANATFSFEQLVQIYKAALQK